MKINKKRRSVKGKPLQQHGSFDTAFSQVPHIYTLHDEALPLHISVLVSLERCGSVLLTEPELTGTGSSSR